MLFEKASRLKLRFSSTKGLLTVEDLWDRTLQDLNTLAKSLNNALASTREEDFLEEESKEDVKIRLSFDVVLHILKTKKDESEKRKKDLDKKAEKEKILNVLAKKQEASLENMSEEALKKKLSNL